MAGADALNQSLNARAFTTGQGVFFRQGAYKPGSSSGRELVAHELTHVVQQNGDLVRRRLAIGQPGDAYEQEANAAARAAVCPEPGQAGKGLTRPTGDGDVFLRHPAVMIQSKGKEKPITTPLGPEAKKRKSGGAELKIGEVQVTVLPDKKSKSKRMKGRAKTEFDLLWQTPAYRYKGNQVTSVDPVPSPEFKIQTTYGPGVTAKDPSAYGKGTTPEDIAAGKTKLGYHEGSHGLDYMQYLKDNPLPKFKGQPGMTRQAFEKVVGEYNKAMEAYRRKMDRYSQEKTDCVGKKADFCAKAKKKTGI